MHLTRLAPFDSKLKLHHLKNVQCIYIKLQKQAQENILDLDRIIGKGFN